LRARRARRARRSRKTGNVKGKEKEKGRRV